MINFLIMKFFHSYNCWLNLSFLSDERFMYRGIMCFSQMRHCRSDLNYMKVRVNDDLLVLADVEKSAERLFTYDRILFHSALSTFSDF